jgi:predicted glycogen debranching enzyme
MSTALSTPLIEFDRSLCRNLTVVGTREWLVTNGLGGYAAGTVAGNLTRRYHGLLVAALHPPLGRTLLVTKAEESVHYDQQEYLLSTNTWRSGVTAPIGYNLLDRFYLDGAIPVWEYTCADALLEKRIWQQQGENTTYVRYHLVRATLPLRLQIKILVNYRDYHSTTHAGDWRMAVESVAHGLVVTAYSGGTPVYLLSDRAVATPQHEWYRDFYLSVEAYRGLDASEDHLYAGEFTVMLQPGENVTLVTSTQAAANLDGERALAERQQYEAELLQQAADQRAGRPCLGKPGDTEPVRVEPPAIRQLVLAADQFLVRRSLSMNAEGRTVIAGYPWFGDWGRDTMIALPGLTLSTGRVAEAACVLRTFAHFVDQGMLPNRFPDAGELPEYNTVDATLWYFEAIRAYHAATGDTELLRELFPVLAEIIAWHQRGTRYQIQVDPQDGLLYAGEPGVQLTWMDAKIGDWVVTPRTGKAVEINALWYNALRSMADFAQTLGETAELYSQLADHTQWGFQRFWYADGGYCYDVIDVPDSGPDAALRPNQIFAVSLPHSPLTAEQQQAVVDRCARHLLTPHGLRSLAPGHHSYTATYGGGPLQRDSAYHQGTVWGWLLGPFVQAHLRVYQNPTQARSYLLPLLRHLNDHGTGTISEIFDAEPPFTPRGCFAQAWSVAETLRAWQATAQANGLAVI